MSKVKTHLMFQGDAEKAVALYSSVFEDFHILNQERYGENEEIEAGAFKTANVNFAGHDILIYDSPPIHNFTFTASISLFVDLDSKNQLEAAFEKLSKNGEVMMALNNYGFSKAFAWIKDQYGVSWQLNLPN